MDVTLSFGLFGGHKPRTLRDCHTPRQERFVCVRLGQFHRPQRTRAHSPSNALVRFVDSLHSCPYIHTPSHSTSTHHLGAMPRRQSFRHPLPTPASPLFGPTQPAWPLARPFPLLPLAIGDFGYALYHALRHPTPLHLTALAGVRAAVLALILVPSARWRARGSWLVAASGATLIACTWEVCAAQLMRNIPDPQPVSAFYLLIVSRCAAGT